MLRKTVQSGAITPFLPEARTGLQPLLETVPALLLPPSPITLSPCLCFWGIPPLASLSLTSGLHVELIEEWQVPEACVPSPGGRGGGEFGPSLLL